MKLTRLEVHVGDSRSDRFFRPFDHDSEWEALSQSSREWFLAKAKILADGERLLSGSERQQLVDRLLGKPEPMLPVFDPTVPEEAVRPYVPDLMNHGVVPAFVAPKGWGKTKLLCSLGAALVIPDHRFLGHFPSVEVTEEERRRDVWLLNPETHPRVVHDELLRNGLVHGYRDGVLCYSHDHDSEDGVLIVEHLVRTSATEFDLTDSAKFDYWATRLTEFVDRSKPPLMVIADGMTAMLRNNTTRYGAMASAFKELLGLCGIPNGLGVLHSPMGVNSNTPMHGIESMAEWDGMWLGSSPAFPIRSTDRRYFETLGRIGDPPDNPPREVVIDDDDDLLQLLIDSKSKRVEDSGGRKEVLLVRLRDAPEGLWTKEVCRVGDDYKPDRTALTELETEGAIVSEQVSVGKMRGVRWRVSA